MKIKTIIDANRAKKKSHKAIYDDIDKIFWKINLYCGPWFKNPGDSKIYYNNFL
ncbi:MAG: hypothetical protein ABI675_01765 [Chitinophagaceae bacterium]